MVILWIIITLGTITLLAYQRASLSVWTISFFILLLLMGYFFTLSLLSFSLLIALFLVVFGVLNIHFFRQLLISRYLFKIYCRIKPTLSETERVALESGTVGWESELLSGMPNWSKLITMPSSRLSEEEREFLEGPVETLCRLINAWEIERRLEIPEEIGSFLKSQGFFGMIIPKKYGGKAFSALGHAEVILKISSVSVAVGTVVSVPNSLGPAELLLRYGTEQQKDYYLPRLANGKDIPCFALTSPVAGSDARSITDYGVVCRHEFEGEEQLCLRLNWQKRYITLSPVATLVGLAFKCYDPEHLIGKKEELGITCALVPTHLAGVVVGRRHLPLYSAFPNGPTEGRNVLIPLSWVIGGEKMIGQGWRMLMDCLAAGRGISLPSIVMANTKRVVLASTAYAEIRWQFDLAIARFEGVQAILARMLGYAYAGEALRKLVLTSIDQGEKPAIASAISKYHTTELSRSIIADAMDLHGGKGICMGPSNYLAQCFIESPISITVEGANILTRCMIIFGQGLIRCHPYLLKEMKAADQKDQRLGLISFDCALFSHLGFMASNKVRSFCLGLSHGRGSAAPDSPLKHYYQLLTRFSAALAFAADIAILVEGANLKRREMITARLGDVLSFLYMSSAVLKCFAIDSSPTIQPIVEWVCQDLLYRIQSQLDGFIRNFAHPFFRIVLSCIVFPRGKNLKPPSDDLTCKVAQLALSDSVRQHFLAGIFTGQGPHNMVAQLEELVQQAVIMEPIEKKVMKAAKKELITGKNLQQLTEAAIAAHILTAQEGEELLRYDRARMEIINVDDFASDEI